jgi:hypothetical protein
MVGLSGAQAHRRAIHQVQLVRGENSPELQVGWRRARRTGKGTPTFPSEALLLLPFWAIFSNFCSEMGPGFDQVYYTHY